MLRIGLLSSPKSLPALALPLSDRNVNGYGRTEFEFIVMRLLRRPVTVEISLGLLPDILKVGGLRTPSFTFFEL